jgi:hypothetical protein
VPLRVILSFVADLCFFSFVLQGLKVGNKILSDAITNEYAKADPVYVEKTIVCCSALFLSVVISNVA